MYIRSKIFRHILITALFFLSIASLYGQQAVVTTVVMSPNNISFVDLSSKASVTVINTSQETIVAGFLRMSIEGDNGIMIQSTNNFSSPLDDIVPGQPLILNRSSDYLNSLFNIENLTFSGLTASDMFSSIPIGTYTICFRAYNNDFEPISIEGTSCNLFTVNGAEPPQLINPFCGDEITTGSNNIVFSWTIPTGVMPIQVEYTFKMIELLPNQDPNQAFLSSTVPAFFEQTFYVQNSFVYGPANPPLETGKSYAWQVIAREGETNTPFINDGKSEVCWFKWNPATINIILPPSDTTNSPPIQTFPIDPQPMPISSLKGKLLYKFKGFENVTAANNFNASPINTTSNGNNNPTNPSIYTIDPNPLVTNTTTVSNKPLPPAVSYNVSTVGAKPLSGVSVSLVVTYLFNGKDNQGDYKFAVANGQQASYMNANNQKSFEQVLATTITGGDGSFNFSGFINPYEDYGLVQADINGTQNSDVQNMWLKGDMYKVLRLKVNNQYYLSPDVNISLNPFESKDIGEVVSLVKSYNLNVIAKWKNGAFDVREGKEGVVTGVKINLVRTHVPNSVPSDEGRRESITSGSVYTIVGDGLTGANGVTIKNLVQHSPNDSKDRYRIMTTESSEGGSTYISLSKTYKPDKETASFPYNSKLFGPSNGDNIGILLGSDITWNHELKVETYPVTLELIPDLPRVKGVVKTQVVEDKPLSDELVLLINDRKAITDNPDVPWLHFTRTNAQGKYHFDNLPMEFSKNLSSEGIREIKGPLRTISTKPIGYKVGTSDKFMLKYGQQKNFDFTLEADGLFRGYVEDDDGNVIKAYVHVEGLAKKETQFGFIANPNNNNGSNSSSNYVATTRLWKELFAFKAPSGKKLVTVQAMSNNFSKYDTIIDIPKAGASNPELLKIVLKKKKKRIRFKVTEYQNLTGRIVPAKIIAGAKVTLKDIAGFETPKLTDNEGYVTFTFVNEASSFTFKVEPPTGKEDEYTSADYTVTDVQNTSEFVTQNKNAMLKKAAKISGKVTIETETGVKPLKDALVYFDKGDGTQIETKTDANGTYQLKGIAQNIGTVLLYASKSGELPMVITQSKEISIQPENTVNFDLKYDKEVSMTTIFGFKVEIISKKKENDSTYTILEGKLFDIPSNANFALRTDNNAFLPFANLKIKKTSENDSYGTPIFEPESNTVTLNDKTIDLKLNEGFNAILGETASNLKLTSNNGKGQIKGKVGIQKNSFNTDDVTLQGDVPIYLTPQKGNKDMYVVAVAIEKPVVNEFGIVNSEGKEFSFNIQDFDAVAKQDKSTVSLDKKINLYTHLKTQELEGITPNILEIEAGNLVLEPTKSNPISNDKPIKFKLENWNFESQNWTFDTQNSQIVMLNGLIKTGSIDVPAKNITITGTDFNIGEFNLNEMTLGNIATLQVVGDTPSFGLNPNVGTDNKAHWELRISGQNNGPAAKLNLPGFESGKSINFSNVSLLSNGEQSSTINNNESMRFYNIIDVQPTGISSGDGYIDVSSMTNLGIPKVPESAGFIRYTKENGQLTAQVAPIPFSLDAPGNVTLAIGNDPKKTEIRDGFFKAIGRLTDKEGINLQASIQKTAAKTHIEIEPNQNMQLGGPNTKFKDIEGKIELDSNKNWKKFTFSGELDGFKGVGPGQRQTFTVNGDITANGESINVNNINTPFGNMALTYDLKKSRFLGHLNIDQELGGMKFVGAADLLMGSQGWYFMAGGTGTPPGIGDISVGMIVGDSDYLAPDVTGNIMQFAYNKEVPPTMRNGVSGLFVTGRKDLPIINVPDFKIDLGVMSAGMGASAGMDARVWMSFGQPSGDEFGIGAMAFARVYFTSSSITCTNLSAEARAELGVKGIYNTTTKYFDIEGCGSITVSGRIEQCIPTFVAGCKACVGIGLSKGVIMNLSMNSNGDTDMSFDFGGNCSGAPLSSGW